MSDSECNRLVAVRAIELILDRYGSLGDLPWELAQVIWVTAYRACAIGLKMEAGGGQKALLKSMLLEHGHDALEFRQRAIQIEFLHKMVPRIRAEKSDNRMADVQLVVDMLKWNIIEAVEMSAVQRVVARNLAKADPMYDQAIPRRLLEPLNDS